MKCGEPYENSPIGTFVLMKPSQEPLAHPPSTEPGLGTALRIHGIVFGHQYFCQFLVSLSTLHKPSQSTLSACLSFPYLLHSLLNR